MKTTFLKSALRTVLVLFLIISMQPMVLAKSENSRKNKIVGVWDVHVTVADCNTGTPFFSMPALHKFELGGTGQVVPGGSGPTSASAHMGIWSHVKKNDYQMAFKFFRYDPAGNNIGYAIGRLDISINEDTPEYSGSGQVEMFDINGTSLGMSCPTLAGTRFE